jgi:hypothetical protein
MEWDMPQPPRNPRRAYNQDGNEIPPATVASTKRQGMKSVSAFCEANGCGHDATIPLDSWPDATPIPDMRLKLRCSKCGSRSIKVTLNVVELYSIARGVVPPRGS